MNNKLLFKDFDYLLFMTFSSIKLGSIVEIEKKNGYIYTVNNPRYNKEGLLIQDDIDNIDIKTIRNIYNVDNNIIYKTREIDVEYTLKGVVIKIEMDLETIEKLKTNIIKNHKIFGLGLLKSEILYIVIGIIYNNKETNGLSLKTTEKYKTCLYTNDILNYNFNYTIEHERPIGVLLLKAKYSNIFRSWTFEKVVPKANNRIVIRESVKELCTDFILF